MCERDTQRGTKRYRKRNRESGIELSSARSGLKQRTACKADPWGCPQGLHLLGKEQSRILHQDWAEWNVGLCYSSNKAFGPFLGSSGAKSILQNCLKLEARTWPSCPLSPDHWPGIGWRLPGMGCNLGQALFSAQIIHVKSLQLRAVSQQHFRKLEALQFWRGNLVSHIHSIK